MIRISLEIQSGCFIFLSHGDTSQHFRFETPILTSFYYKSGIFILFLGRPHFIELQRDVQELERPVG